MLTLDNGLRLLATPVPHARSVSISIYIAAGSRYEQPQDAGLSHFAEHLCFKGTERRPRPQDIAVEIDAMGGTINAATDREFTVYFAKVTPEHAAPALDMMADMLRHSLFQEQEVERERGVILEELAGGRGLAGGAGRRAAGRAAVAGPAPRPRRRRYPRTVSAITPQRLFEYYRRQYVANATVVSVAGALDANGAQALVEGALGDWASGEPGTGCAPPSSRGGSGWGRSRRRRSRCTSRSGCAG